MPSPLASAAAWFRSSEAEVFRRELAWFRRWIAGPWGIALLVLAAALCIGEAWLGDYTAWHDPRGRYRYPKYEALVSAWRIFHGVNQAVPLVIPIFLLRRRVFVHFVSGRRSSLAMSLLTQTNLWPGLLAAPLAAGAAFTAVRIFFEQSATFLDYENLIWDGFGYDYEFLLMPSKRFDLHWSLEPFAACFGWLVWSGVAWFLPLALAAAACPITSGRRLLSGAIMVGAALLAGLVLMRLPGIPWRIFSSATDLVSSYGWHLAMQAVGLGGMTLPLATVGLVLALNRRDALLRYWGLLILCVLVASVAIGTLPGVYYWFHSQRFPPPAPRPDPNWILWSSLDWATPPLFFVWEMVFIGGCLARLRNERFWISLVEAAGAER